MQVDDDVEAGVTGPAADLLEIGQAALGEVLAVAVDDVFLYPVADGNADGVQAVHQAFTQREVAR